VSSGAPHVHAHRGARTPGQIVLPASLVHEPKRNSV
jgi:hypothetical protein